jgi:TrmH family RNA methyltransferase
MEALSKAKVKLFASLNLKKFREEHGLYLVEGKKMVSEAVSSGLIPVAIVIRQGTDFEVPSNLHAFSASANDFERISGQKSPEGVLAILPMLTNPESNPNPDKALVLWNIQDPGNLGTLIRTADWFGIEHIVCTSGTVDCFNPKVLRASMGSIFRVKVHYRSDLANFIAQHAPLTLAADLSGQALPEADLQSCRYLLIGNEANGVPDEIRNIPGLQRIYIPGAGNAESLNAAVSAAILCYAWQGVHIR